MFMIVILCLPFVLLFLTRVVGFAFLWRKDGREVPAENIKLQKFLRWSGVALLAAGGLSAAFVYAHTQPSPGDEDDIVDYEVVGGQVFPIKAAADKSYNQSLEATGGKYDVLADQVIRWIARRWHGRNLATTLVVLSGAGCLACFYIARWV
jgi:hypothetical protein